jgi:hypothetical protein
MHRIQYKDSGIFHFIISIPRRKQDELVHASIPATGNQFDDQMPLLRRENCGVRQAIQ